MEGAHTFGRTEAWFYKGTRLSTGPDYVVRDVRFFVLF